MTTFQNSRRKCFDIDLNEEQRCLWCTDQNYWLSYKAWRSMQAAHSFEPHHNRRHGLNSTTTLHCPHRAFPEHFEWSVGFRTLLICDHANCLSELLQIYFVFSNTTFFFAWLISLLPFSLAINYVSVDVILSALITLTQCIKWTQVHKIVLKFWDRIYVVHQPLIFAKRTIVCPNSEFSNFNFSLSDWITVWIQTLC